MVFVGIELVSCCHRSTAFSWKVCKMCYCFKDLWSQGGYLS